MTDGVVELDSGRVGGVIRNGVLTFSGIPYAGSVSGSRRWRVAGPATPWGGILMADRFGPLAPQAPPVAGMSIPGEPEERDEDCLTVNVWTPGTIGRRPVLVWIHGGGFTSGSGAGALYRGGVLAREHDVVVVTCNYRLGALGWLAHPALECGDERDDSDGTPADLAGVGRRFGNWGLSDQIAALRWVQRNIAGFGGDPGNVMVFGESAGGMSISALLGSPAARGVFQRAVVQSGPPYWHTPEQAAAATERLAAELGVPVERSALERVSAEALVSASEAVAAAARVGTQLPLPFLPVVGDGVLPVDPLAAVRRGSASDVPLIVGATRDEAAFFAVGAPAFARLDDEQLLRWVRRALPTCEDPASLIEGYRQARAGRGDPVEPRHLWVAISTDAVFRLPSVRLADAHAGAWSGPAGQGTHGYLFTWESPAFGGLLGSCHALDIPFVFGSVARPEVQVFSGGGDDALAL
nr:carboxylesterase family protein [Actinomycetota bacterium]